MTNRLENTRVLHTDSFIPGTVYRIIATPETEKVLGNFYDQVESYAHADSGDPICAIARVVYENTTPRGLRLRHLTGGKYPLETVLNTAMCAEMAVFAVALMKCARIEGQVEKVPLLLVSNHRVARVSTGQAIDPTLHSTHYPYGYFPTEQDLTRTLRYLEGRGWRSRVKQVKALIPK